MEYVDEITMDPYTPGFVITKEGNIISMTTENHNRFFQNVIGKEILKLTGGIGKVGITKTGKNTNEIKSVAKQNNTGILFQILLDDFGCLPYQGCSSENRIYNGGILYINSLEELTEIQLQKILNIYQKINETYHMTIVKVGKADMNDEWIQYEQIQEELELRNKTLR